MLTVEDRKFAIQDANMRRAAQIDLIKFNDSKAMSLLSLYVTLGVAAVGVALTYFSDDTLVSVSAAAGLGAAAVVLLVGSGYCFFAIESVEIGLPGRGYDFWKVALLDTNDSFEAASRTYILDGLQIQQDLRNLNSKIAKRVANAKRCGIASPAAAAFVGLLAEAISRL